MSTTEPRLHRAQLVQTPIPSDVRGVADDESRRSAIRPKVLIVGGVDVDKRLDLMLALSAEFSVSAAGSNSGLGSRFAEASFPYFTYPLTRGRSPLADLQSLILLRWLYRFCRPDIVHTFATKPCVWGRLAAKAAGVPVVIGTLPGLGALYASRSLATVATRHIYEPLQRAACRLADMTIFQNEQDVRQFRAARLVSPEKSTVIYGSGIRTSLFDRQEVETTVRDGIRRELGTDSRHVVVTMVSRLIRSKGILDFGAAARLLDEGCGDRVRFFLVGPIDRQSLDGLGHEEIERLKPHVTWLGERSDVRSILASTDIFVLPSWYREGVPRVLLEAASMGLPLVSTATPGCEDVVRDGKNGTLVPPREPERLAEAIRRLADDADLRKRYGAESRKLAVEEFDLSKVARRTVSLYSKLLASKPRVGDEVEAASGLARA